MNVESRRTVEALRAGVPNRDAVRQLGCNHPEIESRFREMLGASNAGFPEGVQAQGLVVSGDFGAGKSHLLQHLERVALEEHFVVSKVVVSKETSLADRMRLFAAASSEARVQGRVGVGLATVVQSLDVKSAAYASFYKWAGEDGAGLAPHFPATLYVHEYGRDYEFNEAIVRFWAGDKLWTADLKKRLRDLGGLSSYPLRGIPVQRELALQRLRFASRLTVAAGYKGWIILLDEVELIGRYGTKQRARAYEELARLCGTLAAAPGAGFPGLATVAAITSDFDASVLREGKCDEEKIPNRLRSTDREDDAALAANAEAGMRLIRGAQALSSLSADDVQRTHDELRRIYADAFAWDAPELPTPPIRTSAVMRPLVRRWITEWDLLRLFPGFKPDIEVREMDADAYGEDSDLDTAAGEGGDG